MYTTVYESKFTGLIFSTQKKEIDSEEPSGHCFEHYVFNNDARVGVDGTETAQCEFCTEKDTRTKVGTAKAMPKYEIKNYKLYNGTTLDYKSTITISADAENCTDIKWYVTGAEYVLNNDGSVTIVKATSQFKVYFTAKDLDGNTVTSETEVINVKTGFFDKIAAFFKGIFGSLPKYVQ